MTIHSEVGLSTGAYVVTRAGAITIVNGRAVRASPTTFLIEATEYPGSGDQETDEPEGQQVVETRSLNTDTPLFCATPTPPDADTGYGREADLVEIEGDQWVVSSVKHFKIISGHYTVTVERLRPGKAT